MRFQGIVSGRCFAGNAVLLASCDIVIAADNSNIGLGGPVQLTTPSSAVNLRSNLIFITLHLFHILMCVACRL
jgi:hypothetical protein